MIDNPDQSVREQLHRLIIENRSEDGSIPPADQSVMADEILALFDQISAERETAVRIDELQKVYKQEGGVESAISGGSFWRKYIVNRLAALRQPTGEDING